MLIHLGSGVSVHSEEIVSLTDLQMPLSKDTAALLEALTAFPGVGTKVAHCVMLFGYHRFGAAPVDVWIQRVIDTHYGGVNPFPQYGSLAGLYQQYMFFYQQHVLGNEK